MLGGGIGAAVVVVVVLLVWLWPAAQEVPAPELATVTDILDFPSGFNGPFEVWAEGSLLGTFGPGQSVDFLSAWATA